MKFPNWKEQKDCPLTFRPLDLGFPQITLNCPIIWASLMALQPAMSETQETWVQSLGWKDPLEEEMATHSSILAWEIPWTEKPGGQLWGHKELDSTEQLTLSTFKMFKAPNDLNSN